MNEDKQNFGSWREKKSESKEYTSPAERQKPVDGFVSKEGFVIDEKFKEQKAASQPTEPASIPQVDLKVEAEKTVKAQPETKPTAAPATKRGRSRWLVTIIILLLLIPLSAAAYLFFFYRTTLEVTTSQSEAKITLNKEVISSGTNKVKPGTYTLGVTKDGFVTYSKKIEVRYFKKLSLSVILKEVPKISSLYEGEANYLAYNKESDLYLFYVPQEAAFYRVSTGDPILTTPHQIKNVIEVIWNPDRLTAILKIKNDDAILADTPFYNPGVAQGEIMTYLYDFGRYDLLHQEAKFWGTGIETLSFTPKGDQVAYYFEPGNGEKSLIVANKDNSAVNRILDLRDLTNPKISWSSDLKNIVLTNRSTQYDTNQVYVFNLIDKTLKPVTDGGQSLNAIFDPKGEKIIYGTYSSDPDFSNYSSLTVMDRDGQNKKELHTRSFINQITFNSTGDLLLLAEGEKDKYLPLSINLSDLKKSEYVFSGEIIAPTSIEYLETKNSIIFLDQNKAKLLFLTTKEYD